jgi:hypothetical protein
MLLVVPVVQVRVSMLGTQGLGTRRDRSRYTRYAM